MDFKSIALFLYLLIQKRIPVIFRRIKCFFDGAWRYPAQQVDHGARLVVGA